MGYSGPRLIRIILFQPSPNNKWESMPKQGRRSSTDRKRAPLYPAEVVHNFTDPYETPATAPASGTKSTKPEFPFPLGTRHQERVFGVTM